MKAVEGERHPDLQYLCGIHCQFASQSAAAQAGSAVMRPVANRMTRSPHDGYASVFLHHNTLSPVDFVSCGAGLHGAERGAASSPRRLPLGDGVLRWLGFARRQHVSKSLDVCHPPVMHTNTKIDLDEVAGLNHPVRRMGVTAIFSRVHRGILFGSPPVTNAQFCHLGFEKIGDVPVRRYPSNGCLISLELPRGGNRGCAAHNFYFGWQFHR